MAGNTLLDDRLLTVREAAEFLGYAVGTVRNKVSRGEIPYVKLGYTVRIPLGELRRWIEEQDAAARAGRAGAREVGQDAAKDRADVLESVAHGGGR